MNRFNSLLSGLMITGVLLGTSEAARIVVSCVGNSITEQGIAIELPKLLPTTEYSVRDYGSSGRTVLNGIENEMQNSYSKSSEFREVREFDSSNIIVFELGTNDSKPLFWNAKKENFNKDYLALIAALSGTKVKPKFILCLPLPAYTNNLSIDSATITNEIVPKIRSFSDSLKIFFPGRIKLLDTHTPFVNHPELFKDGVHPTTEGYIKLANLIKTAILESTSVIQHSFKLYQPKTSAKHLVFKDFRSLQVPQNSATTEFPVFITLQGKHNK